MPQSIPFEEHTDAYEAWFDENPWVYRAELKAVKALLGPGGVGVEVGVGTGRFAAPLKIPFGIEPSPSMRRLARERGVQVIPGVAEHLPFRTGVFDTVLMVTTVCFLDDLLLAFREAARILRPGGCFLVAFVDRQSPVGRSYAARKDRSLFYRDATFYSVAELVKVMGETGFATFHFQQTIFQGLAETGRDEPVEPGYGTGSFVVIRGEKQ